MDEGIQITFMMIKLLYLQLLTFYTICGAENYIDITNKEFNNYFKSYVKPAGFTNVSQHSSVFGNVRQLCVYCEKKEFVNIERARNLLIPQVETLLEIMNKSKVTNYTDKFPIDQDYVYFALKFVTSRFCHIRNGKNITQIILANGNIEYIVYSESDEYCPKPIFTETYAEAYERVYGVPISERPWMKEYCQKQKDI